jgi:hypothetical protein
MMEMAAGERELENVSWRLCLRSFDSGTAAPDAGAEPAATSVGPRRPPCRSPGSRSDFKARADKASAEARIGLLKQADSLRAFEASAKKHIAEVEVSAAESWQEVKGGFEQTWNKLNGSIEAMWLKISPDAVSKH